MFKLQRLLPRKENFKLLSQRLCRTIKRRNSSAVLNAVRKLKTGDKLHGYTVNKVVEVPELMLTAVTLDHDKTGAQHCHIAREDSNNCFSVLFRTTPMDSTGVPHILEHTVLCGSQKYPVRDPFFKMINRSMATFMNAMTASDWTMYPFSSQNKKDFENLMSVYLDAVFYPQLRELDFSQEGWRLEHEDPYNPDSPIMFKGVVYNEMKGAFSSSSTMYCEAAQNKLMPSHTYGVVSGGDPTKITDLTWTQLKDFHFSHYHPSNSKFITYGNFPLEDHLSRINGDYLNNFDRIKIDTSVPKEPRWTEPRSSHISCPPDPMAPDPQKQTTVSVSYLLSDITDVSESFILNIIGTLLSSGETSPFYQALLGSNIGSDYAPVVGYDGYQKESVFAIGLQGIHQDDTEKVKKIISDTIDNVIRDGFEQKNIDAVLHQLELSIKHQTSNFGLRLTMNMASPWNHDADPADLLKINKLINEFRQKLANNPKILQEKVKQYFKENPHRLILSMSPDESVEEKRKQEESERLQRCISKLTDTDRDKIRETGQTLAKQQMATEDLSCLPTLRVDEIDKNIIKEPTQHLHLGGVPLQTCAQPTNEVTVVRMISDVSQLSPELLLYLPLFTNVITSMGAGSMDYKALSQEIDLHTGGLNVGTHLVSHHSQDLTYEKGVCFSSRCLDRNIEKMFQLWTDVFLQPDLSDMDRLSTLIRMNAAEMAESINSYGHQFAMSHAESTLTPASKIEEQFDGMTQVTLMKGIAEGESNEKVRGYLEEIAKQLLNKSNMRLAINCIPTQMDANVKHLEKFLNNLPGTTSSDYFYSKDGDFTVSENKTQFELPFSVNHMSKAIQTVNYTHPDYPVLRVLAKLMWAKYLHREIREKGGAYGSGAVCSSGVFSFFSYRDPNSMKTLEVFDDAINWSMSGDFTDQDIGEAKLSLFQQLDKPTPPGQFGMTLFENRITDEMRQSMRNKLFSVSKEDLVLVADRYLKPGQRSSSVSFLGPANETTQNNQDWNIIKG